ncbi:hypothetical protein EYZ11_008372 [Aspergillus tanneri]|uniref:Uncharacterized protein n=1 Tax=Aspergillus tanneri TaxID=1220188 RepID=A0A4S3JCS4_9EURO|nr:uncharacterized protein ATNIH1004_009271 [Aspergillus tanneri]KAA8645060.1 hypothetical protein ATNIH1004_009271 [Aspergillus tanneri]THC92157.1 hypothetical protein EYZ11_008372 [Aspergillus tanneri]
MSTSTSKGSPADSPCESGSIFTNKIELQEKLSSIEEKIRQHIEALKYLAQSRSMINQLIDKLAKKTEDLAAMNRELEKYVKRMSEAVSGKTE